MAKRNNYAYATFVSTADYLEGLMAMFLSLKATGTSYPLYALLPQFLIKEKSNEVNNLKKAGVNIIEYEKPLVVPQELLDNNTKTGNIRGNYCYDKLLVFELTQFDKVVYLDVDIYILQNLDCLFEMPHMAAMIAGGSYPGNEDWKDLSAGILTIVPEEGYVNRFMQVVPEVIKDGGALGDMSILQKFYSDWPQHPELNMGEKYSVLSYYAQYYEDNLGYHYDDNIGDPKSVAIMHYASAEKPWMRNWGKLSSIKQDLQLFMLKLCGKRNTKVIMLEYNKLIRKSRKILYNK